jgi:hypothetical protein
MALACLAAEADHAGDKLAQRGYALIDGSSADLRAAVAAFDTLGTNAEKSARIAPDNPLVAMLLGQPAVRDLVVQAVGAGAIAVEAVASDHRSHAHSFAPWRQAACSSDAAQGVILRWHLDLIGPADGGLRVLPGSHRKGRLTAEEIALLAKETPAVELAVSAGTVLALRPLLVHGSRRRTTRGHRRILHVELAASDPPLARAWS